MIEYIDRKSFMGADVASKAVQMHNVETRRRIEFPEAHEMPAQSKEFLQGPLRLSNFLVTYRAKQMKQRNTQTGRRKRINMLNLMMIFQFMSRMRLFVTQAAQQHWRTRGPPP